MRLLAHLPAAALLLGLLLIALWWPASFSAGQAYIAGMGTYGYVVYIFILATAVVVAPVTVMPLIPVAAMTFGPFITGVLSVMGWTLGATIAFLIARRVGRPLLGRFTNLEKIDSLVARFPTQSHFWFIVLLRHMIPVDLLSYALGITKSVRFSTYFLATLLGVTYFSFAFAYLGEAFFSGRYFILLELGLASLAIFGLGWYLWHRNKR